MAAKKTWTKQTPEKLTWLEGVNLLEGDLRAIGLEPKWPPFPAEEAVFDSDWHERRIWRLDPQLENLNPTPETRNPKPETLSP